MIFAWIEERRTEYPVAVLCRVLGVSRAGYYAWRTRPPGDTARRRDHLAEQIRAIHEEPHLDTYGSPRMTRELNARGVGCCVHTVARVMRQAGIRAKTTRRFVRTTDSNHRLPAVCPAWQIEPFFQKPQQRLSNRAHLGELPEHQPHRFLNAPVRVHLQSLILGPKVPDRSRHDQLAPASLRPPRFDRPLAEQIQLVFVQTTLKPCDITHTHSTSAGRGLVSSRRTVARSAVRSPP